ncbi:hypothetical protein GDO86_006216 [Hymenochirus boettgeri]|uniref:Dual oxidase maturation factor 1 n=1 Tax=Hymenochirus boettgeri TaxID=247094 RepID=A0A8T2JA77_9PIPI|nr:hypothetical protein GDO86_006216 [Hymenochirus boettgeri]
MQAKTFPFYPQSRVPFLFDTKITKIIIICIVTACTFMIILPGIRGKSNLSVAIYSAFLLLAVNFTSDWEVGTVTTTTVYKSFSIATLNVSIGLWIGFKGINITLAGNPVHQLNETINYNEEFAWEAAKQIVKVYKEGLERGLPNPILYVAEKFTIDSPCSLNRHYYVSTHYASAIMWAAFCSWILYNALFSMPVILYGIYMMLVTAICLLISVISFTSVRQAPKCKVKFGNSVLETYFGPSYWLSLVTGLFCLIISLVLLVLYKTKPKVLMFLFSYGEEDDISNKSQHEDVFIVDNSPSINLNEI